MIEPLHLPRQRYNFFEPITIKASKDIPSLGINKNQEFFLPAFLAVVYEDCIAQDMRVAAIRKAANIISIGVAILGTPITGGGVGHSWQLSMPL